MLVGRKYRLMQISTSLVTSIARGFSCTAWNSFQGSKIRKRAARLAKMQILMSVFIYCEEEGTADAHLPVFLHRKRLLLHGLK